MITPYICTCTLNAHLLHYISLTLFLSLLQTVFGGLRCLHMYMNCIESLFTPQYPILSPSQPPLSPLLNSSPFTFMSHYHHHHHHHHHFRSKSAFI
jgi:hypothetical protein